MGGIVGYVGNKQVCVDHRWDCASLNTGATDSAGIAVVNERRIFRLGELREVTKPRGSIRSVAGRQL